MKAYKIKKNTVMEVECEKIEYPFIDSDGDTIYKNTHFATISEAYNEIIKECQAEVSLLTGIVKDNRDKVRENEVKLADACIKLEQLRKEFKDYEK